MTHEAERSQVKTSHASLTYLFPQTKVKAITPDVVKKTTQPNQSKKEFRPLSKRFSKSLRRRTISFIPLLSFQTRQQTYYRHYDFSPPPPFCLFHVYQPGEVSGGGPHPTDDRPQDKGHLTLARNPSSDLWSTRGLHLTCHPSEDNPLHPIPQAFSFQWVCRDSLETLTATGLVRVLSSISGKRTQEPHRISPWFAPFPCQGYGHYSIRWILASKSRVEIREGKTGKSTFECLPSGWG